MKCVLLLGFFCEAVFFGESTSITDPNHEWRSEEVTKVMTLLMKYGKVKLQEKNNQLINAGGNPSAAINQYLVAAVLSETEMNESKNWNNLPEAIRNNNARVEVIFNDKTYIYFLNKKKQPVHGEVLMLLVRQDLPKMIERLRTQTNSSARPFVVLFSHYIPCSDVKHVEYNCAEELANAAIVDHDKYIMLVGFEMIFNLTNKNKSIEFMSMGGIKQFQFENNVFVPLKSTNKDSNKIQRFFQSLFYECLNISQMSNNCCIVDNETSDQQLIKSQILSLYINNIIHHCTTNPELENFTGKLTKLSRGALVNCVSVYADGHTGNDCPYCPAPTTILTIKVCAIIAATFGTELGRLKDPNDPYSLEFEEGPPSWNSLYDGYNTNPDVNRPAVFCLKKTNSIKTMCTKMKLAEKEVPDYVRGIIQKLTKQQKMKKHM